MKTAQLIAGGLIAGTVALGTMGIVEPAQATTFKFDHNGTGGGPLGGTFKSITTTYNDATEELTWSSTFSSTAIDGAWLVLNDGPNPKSHDEELAIFYLDGVTNQLTAYEYSGQNDSNSFQTESFIQSWDNAVNVVDIGGERTLSFSIDATDVNNYGAIQDPEWEDWTGAQFDEKIGIWFHAVEGLDTAYNSDNELTQFDFDYQGWYDTSYKMTEKVPEPGTLGALAVGLLGLLRLSQKKRV